MRGTETAHPSILLNPISMYKKISRISAVFAFSGFSRGKTREFQMHLELILKPWKKQRVNLFHFCLLTRQKKKVAKNLMKKASQSVIKTTGGLGPTGQKGTGFKLDPAEHFVIGKKKVVNKWKPDRKYSSHSQRFSSFI